MKQAYPGTQAVLRAVRLLKAFSAERPGLSLAELSREAGLHRSTAYRLLTALESEALVARTADGEAWQLGPALLALGASALGASDLRAAAHPELVALARATRETATLEVLSGNEVVILDEVMGPHMLGSTPSAGERWPTHATSTGKALLATLPDADRAAFLSQRFAAFTPRTVTDPAALEREILRARERGYATAVEELEPGFVAVGSVVRGAGGRPLAAVSIGGPKSRLPGWRLSQLGEEVRAAAGRIAARMGWSEAPLEGGLERGAARREVKRRAR